MSDESQGEKAPTQRTRSWMTAKCACGRPMSMNAESCRRCALEKLRRPDHLKIVEAAKRTGNMRAVARELGLTGERVRQICLEHGFTSKKLRAISRRDHPLGMSWRAGPSPAAPPRGGWKSADATVRMVAGKLRSLRYQMGLTIAKFGKKVGLAVSQVSRLETGRQGLRSTTLMRLARALQVPPAFFFLDKPTVAKTGLMGHLQACGLAPSKQLCWALRDRRFLAFMDKCANVSVGKMDVLTKALF